LFAAAAGGVVVRRTEIQPPRSTAASPCGRADSVTEIKLDVRGETCPVPLIEVRKALRQASPGDVVEVVGTHPSSKKEIPLAVKALKLELLSVEEEDGTWTIRIKR
jgi:TusA-related sulfurtransferase